jgi:hypothetical protein
MNTRLPWFVHMNMRPPWFVHINTRLLIIALLPSLLTAGHDLVSARATLTGLPAASRGLG